MSETPGPAQPEKFERLRAVLREMFQLDRGDLDFGLYRIMNLKRAEVDRFLNEDLLPQVREILAEVKDLSRRAAEWELAAGARTGVIFGLDPRSSPLLADLRREVEGGSPDETTEGDIYNHLAAFFERYYREGDFAARRRYSSGGHSAYLIPYDGEEVRLHWASADQYYTKTTENYASYVFRVGEAQSDRRVRFEVAAADTLRDNNLAANGSERRFLLAREPVTTEGDDLVIRFEHRPLTASERKRLPGSGNHQQARINERTAARIREQAPADWLPALSRPEPTASCPERTTLDRHLAAYTAKNSFDYFIHKDLGGFLRRELDLYLKNEVLNLDDLDLKDSGRLRRAVARAKAVGRFGGKIIAFLAQLEDFQKRLWLKRKFVLETHDCVTLDRIPEALYPDILDNEAQREEWERLLAISRIRPDLRNAGCASGELTEDFLRTNPYLVLDTRYFSPDFRDRLLESLSETGSLDESRDGLLVHGENFQAARLLGRRYRGELRSVYLDPPYNTDASAILYKNDYKDSSWLSLMWDRLVLVRDLLANDGALCVAIDDEEASLLRLILRQIFDRELGVVAVRSNPAGRKSRGRFSPAHEYAFFFGNAGAIPGSLRDSDTGPDRYPLFDESGRYAWNNLVRHGSGDMREDRPTMFYPIYVNDSDDLRVPKMVWDAAEKAWRVLEQPTVDEVAVWPVRTEDGTVSEKRWHRGSERIAEAPEDYRVRRNGGNGNGAPIQIDFKIRPDPDSMPRTWWEDSKYASANRGPKALKELFGRADFDYPKAVGLVEDCLLASGCDEGAIAADFFAGSGTTAHAVLNLNRVDGGRRKYVVAEMGDHFDTVLLPRLKKVVHSSDWKEGRPVSRRGISQFFRYVRLESWEDTMDSLVVAPRGEGELGLDPEVVEDYRLRYALGVETSESACLLGSDFEDPFAYTLSVVRDGERRETPVDLPETFNLLLGLRESSRRRIEGVLAIEGRDATAERCLVLWRDRRQTDNRAFDAWFAAHRGKFAPFDRIYANGDHTLNALAREEDSFVATTIEPAFRRLMFEED